MHCPSSSTCLQVSIVSQEPVLFNCSIAENISYGMTSGKVSTAEIEKAAVSTLAKKRFLITFSLNYHNVVN